MANESFAALAGAATGLKTAVDLAQSVVNLAGSGKAKEEAVKLYGEIVAAQRSELALIQDKRELEQKAAALEAALAERDDWNDQKQRYAFSRLSEGFESFGYTLRAEAEGGEPPHTLCPHCFEGRKKRVLSGGGNNLGVEKLTCSDCGFEAKVKRDYQPAAPRTLGHRSSGGPNSWMGR